MELSGTVESIIYRNTDNGYTVLELLTDDDERVTAVGSLALGYLIINLFGSGGFVIFPPLCYIITVILLKRRCIR